MDTGTSQFNRNLDVDLDLFLMRKLEVFVTRKPPKDERKKKL